MASSQKTRKYVSLGKRSVTEEEEEEEDMLSMFDVSRGKTTERIVLQRLILIARLPGDLADRTKLGAHYEKLNFQLKKQHMLDNMTGLLLIYPSCLLHVIESSRDVLVSVLKDLTDMQQQPDGAFLEASKVVLMAQNPQSRLFPQWSYKVLKKDQMAKETRDSKRFEEEEESTETLVCCVLSALQKLSEHLEVSKAVPGSVLDGSAELIVSQKVLNKLLTRDELLTPQQHLQMYSSPLNVIMNAECSAFTRAPRK